MPRDWAGAGAGLRHLLPFLAWLPGVNRSTLSSDLIAALTGAIVVLPQGVAFATIAGMPPEYGLYAGMVPAIIAALFGSSRHLVSGPTTAASIVLFSSLSALAEPGSADYVGLALTLTLMVGATQLLMGLARLGALVNFISHSVIAGFTAGAAVLIAASQRKHFFGVPIPRGSNLFETLRLLIAASGMINPYVVAVSLITLLSGVLLKRYLPRLPLMIGVGLSLTAYLNRTSRPHLEERVPDPSLPKRRFSHAVDLPQCPQLRMVRIDGSLFFGAVSHVAERLRNMQRLDGKPRDTALIAHGINFIDVAGAEFLVQEAVRLRRAGRRLYRFRVKPAVLSFLERGGYLDDIGRDAVYESKSAGIMAAVARLDHAKCNSCSARLFVECEDIQAAAQSR